MRKENVFVVDVGTKQGRNKWLEKSEVARYVNETSFKKFNDFHVIIKRYAWSIIYDFCFWGLMKEVFQIGNKNFRKNFLIMIQSFVKAKQLKSD